MEKIEDNQKQEINCKIENLKKSPVFAMSLGSHELFHSNFWQWLINHNTEYSKVFFSEISDVSSVIREQKNRDLTIWTKDKKAYVIENKLKSMPCEAQLEIYQADLGQQFTKGCLAGITDLHSKSSDWKYLSYKDIGNRIIEKAGTYEKNEFEKNLIIEYGNTIIALYDILTNFTQKFSNKLIANSDIPEKIKEIRLDDIVKKLNGDMFAQYLQPIKEKLETLIKGESATKVVVQSWYSNKSSVIDVRFIKNDKDLKDKNDKAPNRIVIGIEIQGGQYRILAERKTKTINKKDKSYCEKVFEEFKKAEWFYNYKGEKVILGKPTSLSNEFNRYEQKSGNESDYHCVYQYWNIEEWSFEYLASQILQDMEKAAKIITKIS